MAGRLEDKVCVITGAASGIGAESARRFAAEGARVVGVDLVEGAEGELTIEADVTDEDQVRGMYERVIDELGRIDVLFNNAGINPTDDTTVTETPVDAWQRVQDVNTLLKQYAQARKMMKSFSGGGLANMAKKMGKFKLPMGFGG